MEEQFIKHVFYTLSIAALVLAVLDWTSLLSVSWYLILGTWFFPYAIVGLVYIYVKFYERRRR